MKLFLKKIKLFRLLMSLNLEETQACIMICNRVRDYVANKDNEDFTENREKGE